MPHEAIPTLPSIKSIFEERPRSAWVHYPRELLQPPAADSEHLQDHPPEQSNALSHQSNERVSGLESCKGEIEIPNPKPSLFQERFFFCTVKKIGELPGSSCIYVETVVDRDSGAAFAKVYPAKNTMNAVDILTSRVLPFFKRRGISIKEIHTRKTSEYCGLPPIHPFETFLANSHIQHLPADQQGRPRITLCEDFYRLLLKQFFVPALRKKFQFSLDELQKDLDQFVEAYNAALPKHENDFKSEPQISANSSVHP